MSETLIQSNLSHQKDLTQILQSVDQRPTLSAYRQAADSIRTSAAQGLRKARIAILATFTADMIAPFQEVESARFGFATESYFGAFNSVRQELLDPQNGCAAFSPDIVFVAELLEDICPMLARDALNMTSSQIDELIEMTVGELIQSIRSFRSHSNATVVVSNFALPAYPVLGIYEPIEVASQTNAIRRLNAMLQEQLQTIKGTYLLDFDRLCATHGYSHWRHDEMWYTGRAPLSTPMLVALGRVHATYINAVLGTPRKCLVLDLDNTLWGGVIGEDGLAGIRIGHTSPGNVYLDIQQAILSLYRRGVLLAICSKNNEADVAEVFDRHPDMILRREHFAASRINWTPKSQNILELASELNIGVDSLVLLDDSPVECEQVRQTLPEVMVWEGCNSEGQPDPLKILKHVQNSSAFDKLALTEDDRRRNQMYQEQRERKNLSHASGSVEDFLESLALVVDIQPVDDFTLPRVIDLIYKTNQFNLTTRRHSNSDLQAMLDDSNSGIFTLRVADRFGDNGIVGVAIVCQQEDTMELDTFLLSCRVIGRTVETAFIHFLANWSKARGAQYLLGTFHPTSKNAPSRDFFAQHGFFQIDRSEEATGWMLDLQMLPFDWPAYIRSAREESAPPETSNEQDRLLKTVGDTLGIDWRTLNDDSSPQNVPNWDSLNHLNLVMAIESEYELSLSATDAFLMQSIGGIRQLLNRDEDSSSVSGLTFADCSKSDISEFKQFIAESYNPDYVLGVNDRYFEWQFASANSDEPYRIRIAKVNGRMAGCLGYIPVDVHVGGKQYKGSWLANWMVHPDFRHTGLGPLLAREVSSDFEITLALGANEEARNVLAGIGWTDFDTLIRYVCVLDRVAAAALVETHDLDWPSVSTVDTRASEEVEIRFVDRFNADAEAFWDQKLEKDLSFAGTRRTESYLNWRYAEHSDFTYRLIEARQLGKLVGLAVYRVEQARGADIRVGRIVEIISHPEAEEMLIQAIQSDAREQRAVALDFFCGSRLFHDLLQRNGFLSSEDSRTQQIPMLYQPIDRRRAEIRFLADLRKVPEASNIVNWYVTKSDGDQDRPN
jgi:FkbH-like protein